MSEHTPTPWNCASRYSSVVGVPIVNRQGRRIGNTALPDMPPEWDHMKRQGEIDAAFICKAVNNHDALVSALEFIRDGYDNQDVNHVDYRVKVYQVALDALAAVSSPPTPESDNG